MNVGIAQLHQTIDRALAQIEKDIINRCGIGDEWEAIDADIQKEILQKWKVIIIKELTKTTKE